MNRGISRPGRRAALITAAVIAVAAIGTGLALASSTPGVIRACANKHTGVLRLAHKCKKHERAVSWSVQGPPGARGQTGATGTAGAAGGTGAPGAQGNPGPSYVWSSWIYPTAANPPSGGGKAGRDVHVQLARGWVRARERELPDPRPVKQTTPPTVTLRRSCPRLPVRSVPSSPGPSGGGGAGYTDQWVNSNLPTENGGGTALGLSGSIANVFPVVAGANTIYLNGQDDSDDAGFACLIAYYGPITVSATYASQNPSSTLSSP